MRPSRSVFDASFAAAGDVFLFVLRCASALPAALFDFGDVLRLFSVLDALDAALDRVCFATRTSGKGDADEGNRHAQRQSVCQGVATQRARRMSDRDTT